MCTIHPHGKFKNGVSRGRRPFFEEIVFCAPFWPTPRPTGGYRHNQRGTLSCYRAVPPKKENLISCFNSKIRISANHLHMRSRARSKWPKNVQPGQAGHWNRILGLQGGAGEGKSVHYTLQGHKKCGPSGRIFYKYGSNGNFLVVVPV